MADYSFYEPQRDVEHNLDCNRRSLATSIVPHFHQAIEITCILSGCIDFTVGDKTRRVEVGDITYAPPYVVHSSSTSDLCDAAVLIVPHRYYADFERMLGNGSFSFLCDRESNQKIIALILELADRQEQGGAINEVLLRSYADRVLGLIADNYTPEQGIGKNNDLILKIIQYVDDHYTENISLSSMATHFGYSKYHFSRLFHAAFHCSLPSYINAVRVRKIETAEDGTSRKSDRILDAGFGSLSTFYRNKK